MSEEDNTTAGGVYKEAPQTGAKRTSTEPRPEDLALGAKSARVFLADRALRLLNTSARVAYAASMATLALAWLSVLLFGFSIASTSDASQPSWTNLLEHLDALLLAVFIAPHVLFGVVVYSFARAFGRALSSSEDETIPTPIALLARQLRRNG